MFGTSGLAYLGIPLFLVVIANVNPMTLQPTTQNQQSTTGGNIPTIQPKVPRTCGRRMQQSTRIVQGENATLGEFPWQVALYYEGYFLCGGILIDPLNVLTAAHCMDMLDHKPVTVVLGDHKRRANDPGEHTIKITGYINHHLYDYPSLFTNDISIVHLQQPARISPYVQPACLPAFRKQPRVGKKCIVTGWGDTRANNTFALPKVLQKTPLTILSYIECHRKNSHIAPISKSMFCAANTFPSPTQHSACHGDSGGPLVCQDQSGDGSWVVEGVVSWGSSTCDTKDAYTVFAKVSYFVDWIKSKSKKTIFKKVVAKDLL